LRPVAIIENLDRGMTCDVAVIGSCLADLTAANYLMKLGYQVALFEKPYVVGDLLIFLEKTTFLMFRSMDFRLECLSPAGSTDLSELHTALSN
jgi:heterodisulfide reductase subunit A-like polyferredoxin